MATISKDTPLHELTLRKYEKPYNIKDRDLVRKLCLSMGLLQPGDSRDVVVDVLYVLLNARRQDKMLHSEEIKELVVEFRKQGGLTLNGIASSNIRRQLKRLRDIFLIEKIKNNYRVTEFDAVSMIFEKKIEKFLLATIMERVKDYLKAVDDEFSK